MESGVAADGGSCDWPSYDAKVTHDMNRICSVLGNVSSAGNKSTLPVHHYFRDETHHLIIRAILVEQ